MSYRLLLKLLIPISFFLLLNSCRKTTPEFDGINCTGNCYILTGRVIDTPSNAGLQGVELKFFYRPPGYALLTNPTRYLGKTTTNQRGEYNFRFDGTGFKEDGGYYKIQAVKAGYFYGNLNQNDIREFDLDSADFNVPFNQDFALYRVAKLTVRFVASTVTSFDFLTFSYNYGPLGTGIIFPGGRKIDTTITYQTAGDISTFVQWGATGSNINIRKKDTLVVARGGTAQYQVVL